VSANRVAVRRAHRRSDVFEEALVLDPKLMEILACPRCKGPLTQRPDRNALDCAACALRYRIEDGIPVMLVDEAEPLQEGETR
jgi:hypothetical protein